MRVADLRTLFDFNDWANDAIVYAAQKVSATNLNGTPTFTYRSLKETLLHILDVEWSWRIRLRGEHPELWDTSLSVDAFRDLDEMSDRWRTEQRAMRDWLDALTDDDLAQIADIGNSDRFPLWYYLFHIVTHSEQQRRDAQLLLRSFDVEPPDLEFLWYADKLAET